VDDGVTGGGAKRRRHVGAPARMAIVATIAILLPACSGAASVGPPTTGTATTTGPSASGASGLLPGIQIGPAPWPAETEHLAERMAAIGMPPLGGESVEVHTHQNLAVFVHGERVPVPLIGQVRPGTPRARFAEIHTHSDLGTIHVESAAKRHYTLEDVFDVWGVRLSWGQSRSERCLGSYCDGDGGRIQVFLDGQPYPGDPTRLLLRNEQVLVVTYGNADELPEPIPSRFRYERPILAR
jgi:hypothetical protein